MQSQDWYKIFLLRLIISENTIRNNLVFAGSNIQPLLPYPKKLKKVELKVIYRLC